MAYLLTIPLCLLGRFYEPLWRMGGRILCWGVSLLLDVQAWLDAEVLLDFSALSGPFISVSNHRSHLDMFFLLARIANIRVIAKRSLFYVPFLGIMMRVMKMIPVKRGDTGSYLKALETAKCAVTENDPVHIFPEMTRCEAGFPGVQPFNLAPFKMIREAGVPLIPIVFCDTDRAWPKGKNALSFRRKVKVRALPPLFPKDYPDAESLRQAAWEKIDLAVRER